MGDRGDILLGWLVKLVAALAVLGVLGHDLVSLGAARFQGEDSARSALRAAGESYRADKDLQKAYDAALAEVAGRGDTIDAETFTVGPDGRLSLTLRRTAPTLLVEKVPALRSWAEVDSTVSGRPPS